MTNIVTPKTFSQIDDSAMPPPTVPSMASIGLYMQQVGRILRGRQVHAQRARKLRRRGENVRFSHHSPSGRAVYRWIKQPPIIDFKHHPDLAGPNEAQIEARKWTLGK